MDYIKLNIIRVYNFKKIGRPNIASRLYVCIVCRCLPHRSAPSFVFKNKHVLYLAPPYVMHVALEVDAM